ncbi:hypothetical protein JOF47_000132 [Paeniglutamicibacter kerguelensis]|uniref:Uncharacterized protein n=1 Tax=Paeniglutamicibacter kerguelensis TaxID=254788 RepID=A0ABS4X832_9MICC|nr:hypothetical protein [Paeniglutamicibacter kerguelensis]
MRVAPHFETAYPMSYGHVPEIANEMIALVMECLAAVRKGVIIDEQFLLRNQKTSNIARGSKQPEADC